MLDVACADPTAQIAPSLNKIQRKWDRTYPHFMPENRQCLNHRVRSGRLLLVFLHKHDLLKQPSVFGAPRINVGSP